MLSTVIKAKWRNFWEAILWTVYHAGGSLLPVWFGLMLLAFTYQPFGFAEFIGKGEFAIYSAAVITPVIFTLVKEGQGLESAAYTFISLAFLIVASFIFLITGFPDVNLGGIELRNENIRYVSVCIYVLSLFAALMLRVHDNALADVDINEERQQSQQKLDSDFDREMEELGS